MTGLYQSFSVSGINALPRFGLDNIKNTSKTIRPLSRAIALYLHIPYCKNICQFCMLRRGAKAVQQVPELFVGALLKEFSQYRELLDGLEISTVYFGGGTPSMLSAVQFNTILASLYTLFNINSNVEITFEGEAFSLKNNELLTALKNNGVKRISFGLQTFDEDIRKLLGRTDEINDLYELRDQLDNVGFEDINVDYLYNLPGTDVDFMIKDLEKLKEFAPTSVDCHPLKYISCSSFMLRQIVEQRRSIPHAELRIEMFRYIKNWTAENSFIEQFADQYTKNNSSDTNIYMQHLYGLRGGEYIGFGPGARSHFGDYGFTNLQQTDSYVAAIAKGNKPVDRMVYAPMNDNYITCFPKRNDELYFDSINKSNDTVLFSKKLDQLSIQGYLTKNSDSYFLTEQGLNWYQNLQEELLSSEQGMRHKETASTRISKLQAFNGYFDNLGLLT